jgi:chromosomal replication initiation ATPase DnaA
VKGQLGVDLPARTALARADFMVAPSNAVALAMVEGWRDWPGRKLVLTGPAGAGKTHLAHVWADLSGARLVAAGDLAAADIAALASGPVVVEDAARLARDLAAETALFHLHNLLAAEGQALLLTAAQAPAQWGLGLPDLASRMQAAAVVALAPPDDTLLAAVLVKLFADRQITPAPDLIPWLVTRMDRSLAEAARLVDLLDRSALAAGRPVNRRLAIDVLTADRAPGLPLD